MNCLVPPIYDQGGHGALAAFMALPYVVNLGSSAHLRAWNGAAARTGVSLTGRIERTKAFVSGLQGIVRRRDDLPKTLSVLVG